MTKPAKRSAKSPPTKKLYQCRVRYRGHVVHESETADEQAARKRVAKEAIKAGVGAIGTVLRVDRKRNDELVPVYECRCVHEGKKGKPGVVPEDHTTPPPPEATPDAHA